MTRGSWALVALFFLLCLVWGSSFIMMKVATPVFGGMRVSAYRLLLGGLVLLPLAIRGWRRSPIQKRHLGALLVLVTIGNAIPFTVQPFVIDHTGNSAFMGLMVVFVPVLTIFWSRLLLKTRESRSDWVGVVGGLICLLVMLWDVRALELGWVDVLLACSVPICYSWASTLVKRDLQGIDTAVISAVSLILAGLCVLVAEVPLQRVAPVGPAPGVEMHALAVWSMLALGIVSTGLATAGFFIMINRVSPLYLSMASYVVPLVAIGWGWSDGESVSLVQTLAMTFVMLMVAVVQLPVLRSRGGTST